jgi:hypothetical protein
MSAPTGTIFELDMFRERLERRASSVDGSTTWDENGEVQTGNMLAAELREAAAELKALIDNVQAQYCPPAPTAEPIEVNTRRQEDGTLAVYVDHKFVGVVDERQNANPFDHPDVKRLVDAAAKLPAMFEALHADDALSTDEYRAAVCTDAAQIADELAAILPDFPTERNPQ